MKIDYSKIILGNYRELLSEETLNNLKELAQDKRKFLDYKYTHLRGSNRYKMLMVKAVEYAYISKENSEKNELEKTIIVNNIVFNNEVFAKLLNNGNFDKNSLSQYIALVNYIKNNGENINSKYTNAVNSFTLKLVNYFKKYVGIINPELLINKINEVLVCDKELLEEKENNRTR